jgi:hypothetical protein
MAVPPMRVFEREEPITPPPKGYIGSENCIVVKTKLSKQEQWQLDYEDAYKELDDWYPQIETEPITLKEQIQPLGDEKTIYNNIKLPTPLKGRWVRE